MSNIVHYLKILKARIGIARLGEKDIFNWWDVEAQSEGGLYALKRLFKNTYYWSAIEISVRSAKTKIDGLVNNEFIHLYNLTPQIDANIWDLFYQNKKTNVNHEEIMLKINSKENAFNDLFSSLNISNQITKKINNLEINRDLHLIELGKIEKNQLENIEKNLEIIDTLIVGFSLGRRDNLIIPVYKIE